MADRTRAKIRWDGCSWLWNVWKGPIHLTYEAERQSTREPKGFSWAPSGVLSCLFFIWYFLHLTARKELGCRDRARIWTLWRTPWTQRARVPSYLSRALSPCRGIEDHFPPPYSILASFLRAGATLWPARSMHAQIIPESEAHLSIPPNWLNLPRGSCETHGSHCIDISGGSGSLWPTSSAPNFRKGCDCSTVLVPPIAPIGGCHTRWKLPSQPRNRQHQETPWPPRPRPGAYGGGLQYHDKSFRKVINSRQNWHFSHNKFIR